MPAHAEFFRTFAGHVNRGQSRALLITGAVDDLFPTERSGGYTTLLPWLAQKCSVPGVVVLVYELNGPIRAHADASVRSKLRRGWVAWKLGSDPDLFTLHHLDDPQRASESRRLEAEFDRHVAEVVGRPSLALEFLRQLTLAMRSAVGRAELGGARLLILVEAADLVLPAGEVRSLNTADRHRVAVVQDWFSDPAFMDGPDTVALIAAEAGLVHERVVGLPQVLGVRVPAPDRDDRAAMIQRELERAAETEGRAQGQADAGDVEARPAGGGGLTVDGLADASAGLSLHAVRQLLRGVVPPAGGTAPPSERHTGVAAADLGRQLEAELEKRLGAGVVEFKRPGHRLSDVVGASRLKAFLAREMVPRLRATGDAALPGAAVAGPIGGGKTFIFEAVAGELGLPVLVLKNIRSQWFGQTDVLFERLRSVLEALGRVLIFVDEADTQFGGVGAGTHDTERRLTGKVQQMMSDPMLKGRVSWLLMTARVELLSPDIRRPGRVGDLIVPVLDAERGSEDRRAMIRWAVGDVLPEPIPDETLERWDRELPQESAAAFAALRSRLRAEADLRVQTDRAGLDVEAVDLIVADQLSAPIERTRRYQTLQALVHCTRRSLLPDPQVTDQQRAAWVDELRQMELQGV